MRRVVEAAFARMERQDQSRVREEEMAMWETEKQQTGVAAGPQQVRGIWTWGPGVDGRKSKEDGGEFVGWGAGWNRIGQWKARQRIRTDGGDSDSDSDKRQATATT